MMLLLKGKGQLLNIAAVIAIALLLLWPAYVNGEPFYMTDTSSYVRGADAAAHWLTGNETVWTDELFHRFGSAGGGTRAAFHHNDAPVVLAGRSIYYGFLLYLAQFLGNFWAVALLQALLVASSIAVTIHVLGRRQGNNAPAKSTAASTLLIGILLAAFTPVGYFASYLTPDIFGALGLLAFGHLAFLWKHNSRITRAFWFALLLSAMLFHTANLLLISLLTLLTAVCFRLKMPTSKVAFATMGVAFFLAVMGQVLFSWSVKHTTGASPIRPPFVAARIIADGPGYDYLREHCPDIKLIYCRATSFKTRISDSLLWSSDPQLSIFQALSPSEQRLASAQQTPFVSAVFADRPLELLKSSVGAILRQVGHFDLVSFNYSPGNKEYFNQKLPQPFLDHARLSRAFKGNMPLGFVEWSTVAAVAMALVVIGRTVFIQIRRDGRPSPESTWLIGLVVGVLLNAAICGALSTPKGRYQMRLIWVLPFAALVLHPRRERAATSVPLLDRRAAA